MSDQFVNAANENMGAIERLLKGLPGIRGYVDKELRRDADKRLRMLIAGDLEQQKQTLFGLQTKLMKGGGLALLDEMDAAVQKLQILIDRIKTASYGYAGLFDAVKIEAEQLDALRRFDVALAVRTAELEGDMQALGAAIAGQSEIEQAIDALISRLNDLNNLVGRRAEAIVSPEVLKDAGYVPDVDPKLVDLSSVDPNPTDPNPVEPNL